MQEQVPTTVNVSADAASPSNARSAGSGQVDVQGAAFPHLDPTPEATTKGRRIDLLLDLSLPIAIELGRTRMMIRDILDLQRGSVIEFDKLASEPVDLTINGKKMAEGEVVVIEKHFGFRITNLIDAADRVRHLGT